MGRVRSGVQQPVRQDPSCLSKGVRVDPEGGGVRQTGGVRPDGGPGGARQEADDGRFVKFLSVIKRQATDERNYVKKAVNWALRQIGKRNAHLNELAIETAERIQKQDSKAARWIASDALRELTGEKIQRKVGGSRRQFTG